MIKKVYDLKKSIDARKINNCYILCGSDSILIKETYKQVIDKFYTNQFPDLNYILIDGKKTKYEDIVNATETLPFMENTKVVIIHNADFLKDKNDSEGEKLFKDLSKYLANVPEYCLVILYYTFENDREKPSKKLFRISNKLDVVQVEKLKGENLQRKVKELFSRKGIAINRSELSLFCNSVDSNLNILTNEVDKLCNYCNGREITKHDILKMMPQKSENDIFNLVDYISQKRVDNAINILNELLFRGEKIPGILFMIERQFKILLNIHIGINSGKNKEGISKELKLNPYVAQKMIAQSRKFSFNQLKTAIILCAEAEKNIKSTSLDSRIELELLILNSIMAK